MARILVVEDEPTIALGLTDDLTLEGHEVETIPDGAAAFARALTTSFDLILLDVKIPGMGGFELLEELRALSRWEDTPVIMLTGMGREEDVVRAFELGADDYVLKPFSPVELLARVQRLLRKR